MKSDHSSLTRILFALAFTILCCLSASSQTGPGTAVSLNGTTNAWLNVPNGTWFSGNFTVEAWVKVNSYNSWSRLIDFSDGPNTNNVYLALSDGTTGDPAMGVFTNNDTSPFFSPGTQLPLNQWVHLAGTGNGTNGTIYLNGTPVGTGMLNIAPNIVRTNNYIGRSVYSGDAYANAAFDDLRIWNVARTRVQIQTGMNHPLVGNEPGLAGYWRFDEGNGTNAFDSTGNGNTATLNSGVTWTNSTAPLTNAADYALSFNGAQVVTIPHQAAHDSYPFTVMCWFMEPTTSPGGGALVGNYVSSSFNGWQLAISGGLYAWYYRDSGDHVGNTSAGAVNDGLWHHAAFVVNSAGGVIYLDGVPKQTNAWVGTAGPCTTTEAAFLGIYQGDSLLTANEDEVSIWNVALTPSQIQTYMHQPLQGTETGLVSYYRMNEGIGTNIYDYTTNAVTGTFSTPPPIWITSGAQIQEPPQVVTLPATTNGNSVTLSGTINPQGLNSGSWFQWGLTTGYGNTTVTNTFAASYTISTNSVTLNGLAAGTYHFQIVATNSSGTNYGVDQTFTITVSQTPPQVATLPATLNGTSATLSGTVNPEGLNTGSWFNWGLTTSYGNVTPINTFAAGFNLSTNSSTLSGLAAGTYHFQIVATNALGTNYGVDQSFTIQPPQVVTFPATLNGTLVTLSGTVNPEGQNAGSWFNWGLTTSYGNVTPINTFPAGFNLSTNTSLLNGLFSGTYHFQIVATNAAGTSYGADQTFTIMTQFQLGNTNVVEGQASGEDSVVLSASPTNAGWSVTANASWLHALTHNGIGNTNVIFSFDTNSGTARSGTLTIAGQTLTVGQAGSTFVQAPLTTIVPYPSAGSPTAIAVDSIGDVYIATYNNGYGILEWTPANNAISTNVPFNSGLSSITGIAVDGAGDLFSTDYGSGALKEWPPNNGVVRTLFSGMQIPAAVAVDASGNAYFADQNKFAIYEWVATNNSVKTLISGPQAQCLAADAANNLYFSTQGGTSNMVRELIAQNGKTNTLINYISSTVPVSFAVDGGGNLYIANYLNNSNIYTMTKWSAAIGNQTTLIPSATLNSGVKGVAVDTARNLYISIASGPLYELPNAFLDPTPKSEPATAGTDSLPGVLPASFILNGPFAPTSNQPWLTITGTTNGVVTYSFTANTNTTTRTANIHLLGQTIAINQAGLLSLPPQVTTLPATLNGTSATLRGTLNPEEQSAAAWFNWGSTTNYGNATAMNTFAANYAIFTNTAVLSSLSPGGYHFQIVATNAAGTNYGGDQSFTITPQFQLGNTNLVEGPASGKDSVVLGASPTNAAWSATANASWLHLMSASGTGSTNVIFSFDANSGATRAGTLTIAGQTLTVTQAGSTYLQASPRTTIIPSISISDPFVISADGAGDIYIVNRNISFFGVFEWTPVNDAISTNVPYSSSIGFIGGLAVDSAGNLFFTDSSHGTFDEWTATNGVVGTLASGLTYADAVAVDASGNAYYSDLDNFAIYEWVAANSSITTLLSGPQAYALAADVADNLYFTDTSGNNVEERIAANGRVNTLVSYGSSLSPLFLAVDGGGNLYIATENDVMGGWTILKWSAATGSQTTIVPATALENGVEGLAVDGARNFYFVNEFGPIQELPYTFVDPTAKSEPRNAGSDSLPAVLPANFNLNGPFAPASDQSWLTITGTAGGVVTYSYTANSGLPRTAHIQLLGESIAINQAGPGTLQLGITNLVEGPIGGTDSVIVVVNPATLSWTASPNAAWLHLTTTSQSGDTNLLFTFDTNTNATRTGTLTIGNQTLTVTQAGSNYVAAGVVTLDTNGVQSPYGIAVDSAGNIYLAIANSQQIQEWIATNDTIITLVSNGLSDPVSVAVDSANNLYIANEYNSTIVKWTAANGNLTTLVGSGLNSPQAIALDTAGNVYIADSDNNAIKEWLAASSNVVTLVSTGLDYPAGVAVDLTGNVYIADTLNNLLKEWSPASGNVTVLASNGIAIPSKLAVDGSGNVFMGHLGNGVQIGNLLEWSPDGALHVAANFPPIDSFSPAVDSAGNLYMAAITFGNGPPSISELPRALMVPAAKSEPFTGGNDSLPVVVPANILQAPGLYPTNDQPWLAITGVTNGVTGFSFAPNNTGAARSANIILLGNDVPVNQNAVVLGTTNLLEGPAAGTDSITLAVSPPLLPWTASSDVGWLHPPVGYPTVAVPTNVIFTFDANPGATRTGTLTLGTTPSFITQAGVTYVPAPAPLTALVTNGLSAPAGVAVDSLGDVYISNPGDQAMDEWVMAINSLRPIVSRGLIEPTGVALDGFGNLYYSDTASNVIYRGSRPQLKVMSGLNRPYGVAVDSSDYTYVVVADSGNNAVEKYNPGSPGNWVTLVSGLNGPEGVTLDAFGDVYIADTGNNAVKEWFPANSNLVTIVSTGLNQPAGLAVDPSGNIFIADTGDNAIKEWTAASGTLTTLVGTGVNQPTGVAMDSADDLYIADTGNNAVEELPRAFVDPTAVSEPWPAGSDTWSMILPATVNLLPPFAPTSDQPWLTVTDTSGGTVSFDFTANTATLSPRTAHLNVLGVSVSVTQTNAPVIAPQLTGAQQLGNGQFQFTFTNTPGTTFTVLATTNLMLPLANWVNVGTVSNISPGIYQFTSPLTNSQEFYEVIWP